MGIDLLGLFRSILSCYAVVEFVIMENQRMRRNIIFGGLAMCSLPFVFDGLLTGAVADLRVSDVASSVVFEWDPVSGADRYLVDIGSTPGSKDIARRSSKAGASLVVQQLPADGSTLHATLRARVNGQWSQDSSLVFEALSSPLISVMTGWSNPETPLSLHGSVARFSWRLPAGGTASRAVVMAGTADDQDAYARRGAVVEDQAVTFGGLPLDGSPVMVALNWLDSQGRWRREKPVEYQASTEPFFSVHSDSSQLKGSSTKIDLSKIVGLVKKWEGMRLLLRMGSAESSAAYGVWNPLRGDESSVYTFLSAGLPTDGSTVVATPQLFDGRRWTFYEPIELTAADPSNSYLWGDCSSAESGSRLPRSAMTGDLDGKLYQLLSDGCASDRDYVVEPDFGLTLRGGTPTEHVKGVYVWLAPDSGPGKVTVLTEYTEQTTRASKRALRVIHPGGDIAAPVYVSLASDGDAVEGFPESYYTSRPKYLHFSSLDNERPIKVAEVRLAQGGEDVSGLRKTGLTDSIRDYVSHHNGGFSSHFAAMNGDNRARVTAEIDNLFGPSYSSYIGFYAGNRETCGLYRWVDATGVTDQGIEIDGDSLGPYSRVRAIHGTTVWINWDLVSNEEIVAALNESIESGMNLSNWNCTPNSPEISPGIDWMAKAEAALAGTYDGPTVAFDW